MRKRTKDIQTILDVLAFARRERIASMPEAVEAYRAELRRSIRRLRTSARTYRGRKPRIAEAFHKCADAVVRESARVRRLQRRYASWRVAPAEPSRIVAAFERGRALGIALSARYGLAAE